MNSKFVFLLVIIFFVNSYLKAHDTTIDSNASNPFRFGVSFGYNSSSLLTYPWLSSNELLRIIYDINYYGGRLQGIFLGTFTDMAISESRHIGQSLLFKVNYEYFFLAKRGPFQNIQMALSFHFLTIDLLYRFNFLYNTLISE
ncbi:MAG: hypothetical protein HW421_3778 [Ignavibacteria bacterium]|nr:hypothetical protein [Ignavibacteria bacterium]